MHQLELKQFNSLCLVDGQHQCQKFLNSKKKSTKIEKHYSLNKDADIANILINSIRAVNYSIFFRFVSFTINCGITDI